MFLTGNECQSPDYIISTSFYSNSWQFFFFEIWHDNSSETRIDSCYSRTESFKIISTKEIPSIYLCKECLTFHIIIYNIYLCIATICKYHGFSS